MLFLGDNDNNGLNGNNNFNNNARFVGIERAKVRIIPANYGRNGVGMPLGSLASQFLANVYLNKLDWFVKQRLKAKYYLRYVDDFVILHPSAESLEHYKKEISSFLAENLKLELHPGKSKIRAIKRGIGLLGFRIFDHHKLLRKKNIRKFQNKFAKSILLYNIGSIEREEAVSCFKGWLAYAIHADTYNYRKKLVAIFNSLLPASKNLATPFPTSRRSSV